MEHTLSDQLLHTLQKRRLAVPTRRALAIAGVLHSAAAALTVMMDNGKGQHITHTLAGYLTVFAASSIAEEND